jgi:small subunit ribosomal protein S8e
MVTKHGRKISGGKYSPQRKKKSNELSGKKILVRLNENKRKNSRVRGGNRKLSLLAANQINVLVKGKIQKTKIKNVLETPSNRFLARQNILTKGTIVETELGKAKITSRPSQHGIVNGILLE